MLRSSLKIAPVKPSCPRRMSLSQRAREAGRPRVDLRVDHVRRHHAGERACSATRRAARRRPGSPSACACRPAPRCGCRPRRSRGRGSACRSWPCRPAAGRASGSWRAASTTRGSRWKARSPMTPLRAVVEVEHRREAEVDAAGAQLGAEHVAGGGGGVGRASRRCRTAWPSFIHSSPSARIGGRWVKPSVRKRCTRPPSWSTQISRSGRIDLISAVSSVSWRRSCQLRANRIRPPVSGCVQAAAVVGGRASVPAMSSTTGACVRSCGHRGARCFRRRRSAPRSRFRR